MTQPMLDGTRVLDLSFWLPGPYCSRILADLGAEVIKVERRLMGDPLRAAESRVTGAPNLFLGLNRSKKSLALNLRRPQGREILLQLAAKADVMLESFAPGRAARLGVGYQQVRQVNPRIVYCSLTGYGQDGPYADRPGHDLNYAALAGLFDLLLPGGPPRIPGIQLADLSGALFATIAILAALVRRGTTGEASYLDVSVLDSLLGLIGYAADSGPAGQGAGDGRGLLAAGLPGYNLYRTRDGRWMALAALEPVFWADFCQAAGRDDLALRPVAGPAERQAVVEEVREIFAERSQQEWVQTFTGSGVCCEPVLSLEEALAQPQIRHRGMVFYLEHPTAGRTRQIGSPLGHGEERAPMTPAPLLGQHTEEILSELGYSGEAIVNLRRNGIVAVPEDGASLAAARRPA